MNRTEQDKSRVGAWIGRNIVLLMTLTAAVVSTGVYIVGVSEHGPALAEQEARISSLEAQVAEGGQTADDAERDAVQQVTGLDTSRVADDAETAQRLMSTATTWANGEQYIAARNELLQAWDISPASDFMTVFMPGPEQGAYRQDSAGHMHFAYEGANSSMASFEQMLVAVDGNDWDYLAVVRVRVTGSEGGSVTRPIAVRYTVDADGEITDLMAYPSNSDPVSSGKD